MFHPQVAKWIVFLYRGQTTTGIQNDNTGRTGYNLFQNYPNPFNSRTKIEYSLAKPEMVKIIVYDLLGREINTLYDGYQEAGRHSLLFDCSHYASGVYLYKISTPEYSNTRTLLLIK